MAANKALLIVNVMSVFWTKKEYAYLSRNLKIEWKDDLRKNVTWEFPSKNITVLEKNPVGLAVVRQTKMQSFVHRENNVTAFLLHLETNGYKKYRKLPKKKGYILIVWTIEYLKKCLKG